MEVSEEVLGDLLPRAELPAAALPAFGESAFGVAVADNLGVWSPLVGANFLSGIYAGRRRAKFVVRLPMVLICHGPKITLRCGACGAEIQHVGYDPGQPWPAAKALGGQDPRGRPGWDHRCLQCLAEIANQNEPMDVVGEDSPRRR